MTQDHFAHLIEQCKEIPPVPAAVAHPCDATALRSTLEAAKLGLIKPVLVGPAHKIQSVAAEEKLDISSYTLENVEHSHAAAQRSAELAREGRVSMIVKGSLHSDELLGAIASSQAGLRTDRRLSHVFATSVPSYHKTLFITDAVVNIAPDLNQKADICRNAIDLLRILGVNTPKLAILSAIETISPKIQSTLDAAALVVMARRGQIEGGIIDGPLAFDNAISAQAAQMKGIVSDVAGDPDILVVPNLESGNILFKDLIYLANAQIAGIVLGARVPVALTSRSDTAQARIASCAICALMAAAQSKKNAFL